MRAWTDDRMQLCDKHLDEHEENEFALNVSLWEILEWTPQVCKGIK